MDSQPSSPLPPAPAGILSFRACLLLLPSAVLAGGSLAWSPYPRVEGTGLAFLAALPLVSVVLLRIRDGLPRGLSLALALWLIVLTATIFAADPSDTLGRTRALVLISTGLLTFLAAASLRARGRITLAAGLLIIGLAFGVPALVLGLAGNPLAFAGVLGNPGALSQVLVPAGAAAIALLTRVPGKRTRLLSALTLLVTALHATAAPVNAGLVALIVVALVVTLVSTVKPTARIVPFLVALLLAAMLFGAGKRDGVAPGLVSSQEEQGLPSSVDVGGRASGLAVRMSLARASFAMWRNVGGVGAGQFQAAIPPFREVEETERSRDGVCLGGIREVEHPHNDWLLGFVELGFMGGSAWVGLLLLGGLGALRSLRRGSPGDAALGAALLGVLVNATAHGPFLISPASSALGFALLGAVVSFRRAKAPSLHPIRLLSVLAACMAVTAITAAPRAWSLLEHGRALSQAADALGSLQELQKVGAKADKGEIQAALEQLERDLAHAYKALPDSALLLRMQARFSPALVDDPAGRRALWEGLLTQQPHSFEALYELGLEDARANDDRLARQHWEQALALQPTHPVLLRNLARLAFHGGDEEAGNRYLLTVQTNGCLEAGWIEGLGTELIFAGRITSGRALLARDEPRLVNADAAWLEALGREAQKMGRVKVADALSLLANLGWAREHAAEENWPNAIRLYRQALNRSRRHTEAGAVLLRLEFAAAQLRAGQTQEAHAQLEGLQPQAADVRDLAEWARVELESSLLVALPKD